VLGLAVEVDGPWTDEEAVRITRAELDERFGGVPDDAAIAEAVQLGALEPVAGDDDSFLGTSDVPAPADRARRVAIPAETMRAVERLVGPEQAAEFIALATEQEVRARSLDRLAASHTASDDVGETP
jgi:hypothetical protein